MKFILLAFLSLSVPALAGQKIVISPQGNDEVGRGTLSAPFRSITRAAKDARPGDVILVRGGVYPKSRELVRARGTQEHPIEIRAYPGEHPVLDGRGNGPRAKIEDEKNKNEIVSALDLRHASHVAVDGLEVSGSEGFGISVWECDHVSVRHCRIHDVWSRALGGSGAHLTYEDNEIWNAVLMNKSNQVVKDRAKGIESYWACASDSWYREDGTPSRDIVWRHNIVRDSWGEGISANHVKGAVVEDNEVHDTFGTLIYVDHSSDVVVRRNKLYNNSDLYAHAETGDRAAGIMISSEFYYRPVPMMAENIVVEDNFISNVLVGVGFWRDPQNWDRTSKYRNMKIIGNRILDNDFAAISIKKIDEDEPAKSRNTIANNLLFAAKRPPECMSEAITIRVDDPEIWGVMNNTFVE